MHYIRSNCLCTLGDPRAQSASYSVLSLLCLGSIGTVNLFKSRLPVHVCGDIFVQW